MSSNSDESVTASQGSITQIVRMAKESAAIIMIALFSALALAVSLGTVVQLMSLKLEYLQQMQRNETETRMLEYYILELDGKAMQAGLIDFKDSWSARKQARSKVMEKSK